MRTTRRARASKRGGTRRGGGWKSFFGFKKKPKNNKPGIWRNIKNEIKRTANTNHKPPTKEEEQKLNAAAKEVATEWGQAFAKMPRNVRNATLRKMKSANKRIEGLLSKGKNAFARAPENVPPSLDEDLRKGERALNKYRAAKTRKNAVNAWENAGKALNALSGNAAFKNAKEAFWKDMKKAKCVNTKNAQWRNGVKPDCEGYANYSKAARDAYKAKANANVEAEEAAGAAAAAAAAATAKATEEAKAAIAVAENAVTVIKNANSPAEAESAARALARAKPSKRKHTLYEFLGVSKNATMADIRRGYIKEGRALEIIDPTHEKYPKYFKTLKEAYELLSNPKKREIYDMFVM